MFLISMVARIINRVARSFTCWCWRAVDGAMTFRGETSKNYVTGVIRKQGEELLRRQRRAGSANAWTDDDIQTRFRYNQAFLSVNAMVPSIFMLLLCLIPAIMSAIAVVREKETGSIANFRSTPITRFRVPDRQATSLYRGRDDRFLRPAHDRDFHIPRAAERADPRPAPGNDRLCRCDRGVRRSDLLLHPDAGRSRLRDRDPFDRAGGQFLRNARAGLLALRRGEE